MCYFYLFFNRNRYNFERLSESGIDKKDIPDFFLRETSSRHFFASVGRSQGRLLLLLRQCLIKQPDGMFRNVGEAKNRF